MATKIQKWGNSLGIRFPKALAEHLRWREGSEVVFVPKKQSVEIRPAAQKPALKDLVAGITPENRHDEADWGKARGREIW